MTRPGAHPVIGPEVQRLRAVVVDALHDAIDGDHLIGAGCSVDNEGQDVLIAEARVSEVVQWAADVLLAVPEVAEQNLCGGCRGLGGHWRNCPDHPDWTQYVELIGQAENIGDMVGSNEPAVANAAYSLANQLRRLHERCLEQKRALTAQEASEVPVEGHRAGRPSEGRK